MIPLPTWPAGLVVLLLILAANSAPALLGRWLGRRGTWPVDGGMIMADGHPLFGHSKTWRGLAAALLITVACALLVGWSWLFGLAIASATMAGDLLSSFLKRRLGLPPSAQVPLLDEVPESLFPALVAKAWLALGWIDVGLVVAGFWIGHLVAERFARRAWHRG
jgi:hypothetical protein